MIAPTSAKSAQKVRNMDVVLNLLKYTGFSLFVFFYLLIYFVFRAVPAAYGSSLARGQMGAAAASLSHSQIQAMSTTYTTACSNAGSLTHGLGQGSNLHPHVYLWSS